MCTPRSDLDGELQRRYSCAMQVQWNACYAIGRLFKNSDAAHSAERSRQLSMLLSALLNVIRTNSSFKARSMYQHCPASALLVDTYSAPHNVSSCQLVTTACLTCLSTASSAMPEGFKSSYMFTPPCCSSAQACCSTIELLWPVAQQTFMHLQIQNHATTALSNLGQRFLYGELWQSTVQTIADALISLQKSENGDDGSMNAGMRGPPSSLSPWCHGIAPCFQSPFVQGEA